MRRIDSWGPFSIDEMPDDFKKAIRPTPKLGSGPPMFYHIKTLEGHLDITVGDWIIKGVKGEFYPCKPDIFEMTYEAVNDQA